MHRVVHKSCKDMHKVVFKSHKDICHIFTSQTSNLDPEKYSRFPTIAKSMDHLSDQINEMLGTNRLIKKAVKNA